MKETMKPSKIEKIRNASDELATYIIACRKHNTDEYMVMLAERLNDYCRAAGCLERYEYDGKDHIIRSHIKP